MFSLNFDDDKTLQKNSVMAPCINLLKNLNRLIDSSDL